MHLKYKEKRFTKASLDTIAKANEIIADYYRQGFQLTLRQLYYKFVSLDLIENSQRSYKNLGNVINDGRLAGLISWKAIEDRTRNLRGIKHFSSPSEAITAARNNYAIDLWANQKHRPEVWVEKDALAGIVEDSCVPLDTNFFSCRGYTSQSEMWEGGQRFKRYRKHGQIPIIIHLGDHDPSGKDMTRDIRQRFEMFVGGVEVIRIALNIEQVEKFKLPPNPAKISDSRYDEYIKKFGKKSWELDALEPQVIKSLIQKEILKFRDDKLWDEAVALQREHLEKMDEIVESLKYGEQE